jgi:hypothetical protein
MDKVHRSIHSHLVVVIITNPLSPQKRAQRTGHVNLGPNAHTLMSKFQTS